MRAPTVKRGDRLTSSLWNQLADAVNAGLAAPRDLDAGVVDGELGLVYKQELSRETEIERVTSPDDENVFVDVARITVLTVRNSETGRTETTYFSDS
jgi:hypothetical protein